jgi:RNA polymerase sigma-70 factor (ECF subfamily)
MFEDKQLVNRLKKGDKQALCRIYHKYGDSLLAMTIGIVRDHALAEDAMHDVFLAFVRDIDSFVLTGKLKSYLARCVVNRAIDLLRSRKNQTVALDRVGPVKADTPLPHQAVVMQEELRKLDNALTQLPTEQRQVIMMHIHGQMGYRQIALCQGVSINTTQGRYRYGMKKLRSLLLG